jgi:hypothetical protein
MNVKVMTHDPDCAFPDNTANFIPLTISLPLDTALLPTCLKHRNNIMKFLGSIRRRRRHVVFPTSQESLESARFDAVPFPPTPYNRPAPLKPTYNPRIPRITADNPRVRRTLGSSAQAVGFPLLALPPHLILAIGDHLRNTTLSALARCSRYLHHLLTSSLYDRFLYLKHPLLEGYYPEDPRDYLLLCAVEYSSSAAVRHYLAVGANPNTLDTRSTHAWSMIQIAASEGAIEIVKLLLGGGADPMFVSMDGVTALHIAARKGLLRTIRMLVERVPVDILTPFGESPLHFAASAGRVKVVAFLLESGADAARMDDEGKTPLMCAGDAGARGKRCISLLAVGRKLNWIEVGIEAGVSVKDLHDIERMQKLQEAGEEKREVRLKKGCLKAGKKRKW